MKDIYSDLGVAQGVVPSVVSATTTDDGVDLQGFNSALVIVASGAIAGSGLFVTKLQDSDDDSTFVDVAAANMLGTFPASLAASSVVKVGYIGGKRYIRTVTTKTSGTSVATAIVIVKGHASDAPVA